MRDRKLSEKLQLQVNLTLKDAVQQAGQSELVKPQLSEQSKGMTAVPALMQSLTAFPVLVLRDKDTTVVLGVEPGTRTLTTKGEMKPKPALTVDATTTEGQCVQPRGRNGGPVANSTTSNEFAALQQKSIMSQRSMRHALLTLRNRPKSSTYFLGSMDQHGEEPPWRTKLTINPDNGRTVDSKIDTGADVSVISKEVYDSLQPRPRLRQSGAILRSPGGTLPYLGVHHLRRHQ